MVSYNYPQIWQIGVLMDKKNYPENVPKDPFSRTDFRADDGWKRTDRDEKEASSKCVGRGFTFFNPMIIILNIYVLNIYTMNKKHMCKFYIVITYDI